MKLSYKQGTTKEGMAILQSLFQNFSKEQTTSFDTLELQSGQK